MVIRASTTKQAGDAGEALALAHLQRAGLTLVGRNYRVAAGPRARGGEIDLILRDRDGTLVFVEVRVHAPGSRGGAAASVTATKRKRLVLAAQHTMWHGWLRRRHAGSTSWPLMAGESNGCARPSTRHDAPRGDR